MCGTRVYWFLRQRVAIVWSWLFSSISRLSLVHNSSSDGDMCSSATLMTLFQNFAIVALCAGSLVSGCLFSWSFVSMCCCPATALDTGLPGGWFCVVRVWFCWVSLWRLILAHWILDGSSQSAPCSTRRKRQWFQYPKLRCGRPGVCNWTCWEVTLAAWEHPGRFWEQRAWGSGFGFVAISKCSWGLILKAFRAPKLTNSVSISGLLPGHCGDRFMNRETDLWVLKTRFAFRRCDITRFSQQCVLQWSQQCF